MNKQAKDTPIARIHPYPKNPRTRTPASVEKIAASIKRYGWTQPIVADAKGIIIIGHGRYEAALLMKLKTVPVLTLDHLSVNQTRALRLADNRLNRESDWDLERLMEEIKELTGLDVKIEELGFETDDLQRIKDDIDAGTLRRIASGAEDEEAAPSTEGEDGAPTDMVNFSEVLTVEQRRVVHAAIKMAQEKKKLARRGQALHAIAEFYIEENE